MPIAKKIQTTREVLRETEKQGKWRDCIGTAQSLSIQYSQLANQYMRVAAAIENERAALGFSRPGAKAKMAMSANEKAMLVARWHAVTKLLEEARSRLFAAERAQDEVERLKAIKDIQQYSAQRNAATAALKREGMMSRPGAKAVFVRLPDDYARNFQYMKELMGDITRAFKDTDHISLKEAAHDFLGFAKKIREEAFSDAADMKKHPQDWNARPGAKVANALSDACWEGYEAVGTKQKDGKTVPNCVPMAKQEESEEVRSGLKMIAAKDQAVADKIRTLIGEGKDQKQAVAIALDLKRRGEI
jgi:Lon protease-like protein